MDDVDGVDLLAGELLRERAEVLVAEAGVWSVGLSDEPYRARRRARVVDIGLTLGAAQRADRAAGRPR